MNVSLDQRAPSRGKMMDSLDVFFYYFNVKRFNKKNSIKENQHFIICPSPSLSLSLCLGLSGFSSFVWIRVLLGEKRRDNVICAVVQIRRSIARTKQHHGHKALSSERKERRGVVGRRRNWRRTVVK